MRAHHTRIVADGRRRLQDAKGCDAVLTRTMREVSERYAEEKRGASFWRRRQIEAKILREVRARLEKEFPNAALYAVKGVR